MNAQRLRHQYAAHGSNASDIDAAILSSKHARDFALNRHDISNVAAEVSRGTFRRHDDDASSVYMLVCMHCGV